MSVAEAAAHAPRPVAATDHSAPQRPRLLAGSLRLLGSEIRLILGRRRNQAGLAVLAAVPVIVAVASWYAQSGPDGEAIGGSIPLNGTFVPFAALSFESAMFLPLAIAMLTGDSIAGEAHQGTLRYLLTVPVSRVRLLLIKYVSLVIGTAIGVLVVVIPGAIAGVALFGLGPTLTLSGTQISGAESLLRLGLASLYLVAGLSALAAVGLFISTLTEQPVGAAIALMIINILCWILYGLSQVSWLHPYLLQGHWMRYTDVLREPMDFDAMSRGLGVFAVYTVVFGLCAWARFGKADLTS